MPDPPSPGRRRGGLWVEIALNLAFLTGIAIALSAVVVWLALDPVREGRREEAAAAVARLVAARILATSGTGAITQGEAEAGLADLRPADLGVVEVLVVDPGLRLLAASGDGVPRDSARRAEWLLAMEDAREALISRKAAIAVVREGTFPLERRSLALSLPLLRQGRPAGLVRVRVAAGGLGAAPARSLLVLAAYSALAVAVIAGFGFHQFRGLILRPLSLLRDGTARIARGGFDARIPETRDDELGDVSRAFNRMAESLSAYRARVEDQVRDLREVNAVLVRTQQELVHSEKMASVGRLAAGVAHEVGNPLAALLGFAELLPQVEDDPEMRRDLVSRIHQELQRIHGIVGQLLDHARVGPVPARPVDVAAVVASARDLVLAQPRGESLVFDVRLAADLPPAAAEEARLRQVLLNLFLNAADAAGPGGRVEVRGEGRDGIVRIRVADDGPGIPAEVGDRVFEPFFTTKEPGAGTGLGLSVSAGIVEGFGGRLRLLPAEAGAGARFELLLPAALDGEPGEAVRGSAEEIRVPAASAGARG